MPYDQTLRLRRKGNVVAQGAAVSTMPILHQPPPNARLKVTASGAGRVTITASQTSEVFDFLAARWLLGSKYLSSITTIATTGFSPGATVKVESVDQFGNPLYFETEEAFSCSIKRVKSQNAQLKNLSEGRTSVMLYYVQSDEEIDVLPDDLFTIDELDGQIFKVFSQVDNIQSITGDVTLKKEFWATRITI